MKYRPFSKSDWLSFSGAEGDAQIIEFPDDHPIRKGEDATQCHLGDEYGFHATVDNNGIYFMWINGEGDSTQYHLELPNIEVGKVVADSITREMSLEQIVDKFGFGELELL